jgi:acetoin utilization deacetylase AcuC-like enzyme
MKTVFSDQHELRDAKTELFGGELVPPFECPERARLIKARIEETGLGPILDATEHGLDPILAVHDPAFVAFLETAFERWQAAGFRGEAYPCAWPARRMTMRCPEHIDGQLGYFAMTAETAITPGTYEAARAAADTALTAADLLIQGQRSAFALTRPPGHHAAYDMYGGYCFLNNAAIAAQHLRANGAGTIAILDVDFHHGNGTQDIFAARSDIFFASIHGRPEEAFPYFSGHADEIGTGPGEGATLNLPLPPGTDWPAYAEALGQAMRAIQRSQAETLVVSLGTDTFERDPISFFKLKADDFTRMGQTLATLDLPTLFVMEGGYAVEEIGINTVNVLTGFEEEK